jgi:hypothetical protein
MATVLLSKCTNTFHGIYMSEQLGTLTQRPVHPASPVLLTKNGPLGIRDLHGRFTKATTPFFTHLKFENRFAALRNKRL